MVRDLVYSLSIFGGLRASIEEVCDMYSIKKNTEIPVVLNNIFVELSNSVGSEIVSISEILKKTRRIKNKNLIVVLSKELQQIKKGLEEMESLFEDYGWLLENVREIDTNSIREFIS